MPGEVFSKLLMYLSSVFLAFYQSIFIQSFCNVQKENQNMNKWLSLFIILNNTRYIQTQPYITSSEISKYYHYLFMTIIGLEIIAYEFLRRSIVNNYELKISKWLRKPLHCAYSSLIMLLTLAFIPDKLQNVSLLIVNKLLQ